MFVRSRKLSLLRAMPLCLVLIVSSNVSGQGDSRGLAVVPPGYETLLADMLGRGQPLPASCNFAGARIDRTLIQSNYSCPSGDVVFELHHPQAAPAGARTTDRFALVVADGTAPDELVRWLEERVHAREAEFEWSWMPLSAPEESTDNSSLTGRTPILALLFLLAGVVFGWWLVRSARWQGPVGTSPVVATLGCTVLAVLTCLSVHGALRLTGDSLAAIVRGEALSGIALRSLGVFGLIVASAVAVALLGRLSRWGALRLWVIAIVIGYTVIGYGNSLLPDDPHYFGPLSTYPPNASLTETLSGQSPVTYRINARGFRYPDFEDRKTRGTIRVALIGDSFVFGIGVDDDGTLGRYLESELARLWPGPLFEVLNLGIPGDNLASHVEMVEVATARLEPDVVVLALTLANDLSAWDEQDARRNARRYGIYSFVRFLIGDSVESLWALIFLERETTPEGIERLDAQLRRLEEILRESPGRPVLVIFGFQAFDQPITARLNDVPNALVVPNRTTMADEFIPGDGHPTALGNQRSAAHIARALSQSATWQDLVAH